VNVTAEAHLGLHCIPCHRPALITTPTNIPIPRTQAHGQIGCYRQEVWRTSTWIETCKRSRRRVKKWRGVSVMTNIVAKKLP
jgi:hypothetical protein